MNSLYIQASKEIGIIMTRRSSYGRIDPIDSTTTIDGTDQFDNVPVRKFAPPFIHENDFVAINCHFDCTLSVETNCA
jgi:hypothetical protein